MNKNIYIGFDRDGTLEMPGHPVPERLIEHLEALKQMGAKLFLASGKNYELLSQIAAEIKLDPWMICAETGGHIVIPSKKINYVAGAHSDLATFKEKIHAIKLPPHGEEPKLSVWSKKFGDHALEAENIIKNFIAENHWNLVVYSYPDGDGGLDVVPPGIDKVNLLEHIPAHATIYYIGDDHNDLGLLAHDRIIPCTVANAKANIKETVSQKKGLISSHPAGKGVVDILSQLFSV
ncbi:MAG: HAD hydrolase family protein [Verrucomicrobiota bacterium]